MLDPEYIRHMTDASEQLASVLHSEIIKHIVARLMARLARGDRYLTSTDKWALQVLQDAGYLMEDIQREIAERTPLLLDEVAAVFEDACVQAFAWDDAVYRAAGLEGLPLKQSPHLLRLAQRNYEATCGELRNFTGTMAEAAQQTFIRECDRAYQLVAGGAMGYTQAVRQAVETVAAEGVTVTYPSGHRDTIETATLRAVRTGVSQACGEITLARMREMHWPIVLVSAHLGARTGDGGEDHTNHFWWQGKFYRLDDEAGSGTEDAAQPQDEAESTLTEPADGGIIEKKTPPEEKPDVHTVGHIDREIYKCVTEDIQTDEVILTDVQIAHIQDRHPSSYERIIESIPSMLADPDFIIEANKANTAVLLKEFPHSKEKVKLILRLKGTDDPKEYKNSVISCWLIGDTTWRKNIKNKKILYRKE